MTELAENRTELEEWLLAQPLEYSLVIALRSALRVFPLIAKCFDKDPDRQAQIVALPLFRAIAIEIANLKSGGKPNNAWSLIAKREATKASSALKFDIPVPSCVIEVAAILSSSNNIDSVNFAIKAIEFAEEAVLLYSRPGKYSEDKRAEFIESVNKDWENLSETCRQATDLLDSALWIYESPPEEILDAWHRMRSILLSLHQDWDVWIEWYEALLQGSGRLFALDQCVLELEEEIWDEGPVAVNPAITKLIQAQLEELSEHGNKTDPQEIIDSGQTPAAYLYKFDGKCFDVFPVEADLTVSSEMRDGLVSLLQDTLKEISKGTVRSNAFIPSDLEQKLEALAILLSQNDTHSAEFAALLLSHSRSLKRLIDEMRSDGGCGSGKIDHLLYDLQDSVEDLKSCYSDIVVMEREKLRREVTPENADATLDCLRDIADDLRKSKDGFSDRAARSLDRIATLAEKETDASVRADLAVDQTMVDRNLSRAIENEVRKQTKSIASDVGAELRKGAAKWIVRQLAETMSFGLSKLGKYMPSLDEVRKNLIDALNVDHAESASEADSNTDESDNDDS